jgi:DNA-binding GntR family transcriptional regulator
MDGVRDPIDIRSLHDRVYGRIRDAMRKGVFSSGQTLTIRGLASRFGTSDMPIREAIKRLTAEKALVQQADRTFKVPPITPESFEELVVVRVLAEGCAAELAAVNPDPDLIDRLRLANADMARALSNGDLALALESNQEFHSRLYEACDNAILLEVTDILWLRSGPYLAALVVDLSGSDAFRKAVGIHERIIAAIETGNGRKAAEALRSDIESTAQWFRTHRGPSADATPMPNVVSTPIVKRRRAAQGKQ